MKQSFYIYSEGQLQRKDNTLRFQALGGKPRDLPIETVSDIYIMTEMTVNTALLNLVSKYGIALHFFNYYDHYIGSYYPKESLLAGQLLVHQVSCYQDENRRLQIAKSLLMAQRAIFIGIYGITTTVAKTWKKPWRMSCVCGSKQRWQHLFQN